MHAMVGQPARVSTPFAVDSGLNQRWQLPPREVTQATLSDAVKRFLTDVVVSVERLDVLLFIHRSAARWWPAEKLAPELGMPADTVQTHLEHLSARNLLDVRIAEAVIFCYKPAKEELSRLVEEVAKAHYSHRDAV